MTGVDSDVISPIRFANILLRGWKLIALVAILLSITVFVARVSRSEQYTAITSFVPQSAQSSQSQLSALAGRFGLDVGPSAGPSPSFYRAVLESNEILKPLAASTLDADGKKVQVATVLGVPEGSPDRRLHDAARKLRQVTSVSVEDETGLVNIEARSPSPKVSIQIVTRMLELLHEFNLRKRQEQANAERAFMQGRLDDAQGTLRESEDQLQRFLQGNRQFQGDPRLTFEYDRLRRDVEMKQAVYTTLAQSFEQASINALRDTPAIAIVQRPEVRPVPDSRHVILYTLVGFVIGAFFAGTALVVKDMFDVTKERFPEDYAHFTRLRETAWRELSHAGRRADSAAKQKGTADTPMEGA